MAGNPGLLLHLLLRRWQAGKNQLGWCHPETGAQNDSPRKATRCIPKFNFNKEHFVYLGCLNKRDAISLKFYSLSSCYTNTGIYSILFLAESF